MPRTVDVTGGSHGYRRLLVADTFAAAGGDLVVALDAGHDDGPWERGEDYDTARSVVRWSRGDASRGASVTAMAYAGEWRSRPVELAAGVDVRHDDARNGLFRTRDLGRVRTVRADRVDQWGGGPWASAAVRWSDRVRTTLGLRAELYRAGVESDLPANSGTRDDALLSPKLAAVFGPFRDTELYVNLGRGHHSNDARGATLRVDPVTGLAAPRVDPLVRARGTDVVAAGLAYRGDVASDRGWSAALRLRYFGDYPLVEDGSVRAGAAALLAGEVGYAFPSGLRVAFEGFNLLDREDSDVEYFYASRLPGEPAEGVEDVHFHPVERPALRLGIGWRL